MLGLPLKEKGSQEAPTLFGTKYINSEGGEKKMKYVWLLVVIAGAACVYLGMSQVEDTGNLGRYPCFFCAATEPDCEVIVFAATDCLTCEAAVGKVQRFCRLTGVKYGAAFYDGAEETAQKLSELGLEKDTDFLLVILRNGVIIGKTTNAETAETFLSDKIKEASRL